MIRAEMIDRVTRALRESEDRTSERLDRMHTAEVTMTRVRSVARVLRSEGGLYHLRERIADKQVAGGIREIGDEVGVHITQGATAEGQSLRVRIETEGSLPLASNMTSGRLLEVFQHQGKARRKTKMEK